MTPDQARRIGLALQAYDMIMFALPRSTEQQNFSREEKILINRALNTEGWELLKKAGFDTLTAPEDVVKAVLGDRAE